LEEIVALAKIEEQAIKDGPREEQKTKSGRQSVYAEHVPAEQTLRFIADPQPTCPA